jgi:glycosyltransferase involved in cell wall biosynthesis
MKIVHLSYADGGGGAAKAAYRIHRGIRSLGVDSYMLVSNKTTADPFVMDPGAPAGRIWAQVAAYLDILPWRLVGTRPDGYSSLSWVGTGAVRRAERLNPDIVHLHWINSGLLRLEELKRVKCPVVWRLADMWPMAGAEHYVGRDLRYEAGYSAANRPTAKRMLDLHENTWKRKMHVYEEISNLTVVSPSQWLADCARKSALFSAKRIEVIPTGQNLDIYRPISKEIARSILDIPPTKKIIMTASMQLNDKRKGADLLMNGLGLLKDCGYAVMLLGGATRLTDWPIPAYPLGKLNDDLALAIAYSAADVFVAPSREENLPNTVIESMACGTPAVAFNIGGMPDLIRHMRTGYLAQAFDPEELAHGIELILENDEMRAEMALAGRTLVEYEHSEKVQAQRYLKLYEDILNKL